MHTNEHKRAHIYTRTCTHTRAFTHMMHCEQHLLFEGLQLGQEPFRAFTGRSGRADAGGRRSRTSRPRRCCFFDCNLLLQRTQFRCDNFDRNQSCVRGVGIAGACFAAGESPRAQQSPSQTCSVFRRCLCTTAGTRRSRPARRCCRSSHPLAGTEHHVRRS